MGDEHRNPPGGERNNRAGESFRDTEDALDFSFLSQSTHNNEKEDTDGRSILQGFVVRHLDPRLASDYLGETCFKED